METDKDTKKVISSSGRGYDERKPRDVRENGWSVGGPLWCWGRRLQKAPLS